jgi:multiple sugar transport system substrate-binding protein
MKRIFSTFLIGALCCGLFLVPGCNPQDEQNGQLDAENPTVIEVWHYYNGPQKMAFDALVSEFNETMGLEKGIVVETIGQGSVNDLTEKVLDAANKKVGMGEIPEIFAAYADTAYQIDQMGLVADIGQYMTEEELEQYIPEYLEEGRIGEGSKLKIFPTAKSTEVFMLNQTDWDKFAQATGASTDALSTIEGLTKTAQAYYEWTDSLTPELNDGKAFFGRDAMANYMIIGCKQLGTEIFQVTDGKVSLNYDQEILRKLWDNFYIPYINGYFAHYGRFRSDDAKTGDLIALVGSTSGAAYFPDHVVVNDEESYPIEVSVLPTPCFENGTKVAVQQGAGMVVSKTDEKRERASLEFLKWFTQEERNIAFSIESGYLPVKTAANDAELLLSALDQLEPSAVTENLKVSMPVAVETVNEYELYTSKAFENGTNARAVLENSMIDKAKADRDAIVELMAGEMSREEAIAQYDTDENFDAWFAQLKEDLDEAVNS